MPEGNPFKRGTTFARLLSDLTRKPQFVPAEVARQTHLTDEDKKLLKEIGLTTSQVISDFQKDIQLQYDRSSLYHQLERCLRGSTRVWLLDSTAPELSEMARNSEKYIGRYTLSVNPITLELEPDKIVSVKKTRLCARLVRVHLDNGKYVDCTPDHKFMLKNSLYQEAQHLQPNDSLMPFYMKAHRRGLSEYLGAYNPRTGTYPYIHQHVAKLVLGYQKNRGKVVHHKNFDRLNNDPLNLQVMSSTEHKQMHAVLSRKKHKEDCKCCVCKAKRGERDYSSMRGRTPWNRGLTRETDSRLERVSEQSKKTHAYITKVCACGCGEGFRCKIYLDRRKCGKDSDGNA